MTSLGFRASIIRKTQDESGWSIYQVAKETGISPATLSSRINQYRNGTLSLDGSDGVTPTQRSPGEKLSVWISLGNGFGEAEGIYATRNDEMLAAWGS